MKMSVACSALALSASAVFFASPAVAGKDPFPDTPANRALYESSLKAFEAIDHERGHFATVNGLKMHYLEWGAGNKIPLIWSHGFSSSDFELIQVGQDLADAGYHVYSLAYRGHGQTQVADLNFSLADIADDVAGFMEQKGLHCAVIGGLSLGGGVATTFYENYPKRAMGLVLEDGGMDHVQSRTERWLPRQKELKVEHPEWFDTSPRKSYQDRFFAFKDAAGGLITLPPTLWPILQSWVKRDQAGNWRYHIEPERLLGVGEASIDPARGNELPLLAQSWRRVHPIITYRHLNVPMLMIDPTGDDDIVGSLTPEFEKLQALRPEWIRHVKYPDTPHHAHVVRPDWFVRDMKELLTRIQQTHSDACLKSAP